MFIAWFVVASIAAESPEATECESGNDVGVCLLQGKLRASASSSASSTVAQCPGKTVQKTTVKDTCQCTGVTPTEINEKQDDNFEIKTEAYFIKHATGAAEIPQLEAHPFSEGSTSVLAVYTDFANLEDRCERTVFCEDNEPPAWKYSLVLNDPVFELEADDKCEVALNFALTQYALLEGNSEEGGFAKAATDNCNIKSSTLMVYSQREGKTVYDGDVNSVPVDLNVFGPGLYDFQFVVTDTEGLSIKHDTVMVMQDRSPPTARDCPANAEATVEHHVTSYIPQQVFSPKVTIDNCAAAGLLDTGVLGEGACDPPLDRPVGMGVQVFKCYLSDRLKGNDYTTGILDVNTIPCEFTYTVRQHVPDPVTITCPSKEIRAIVYEDAAFGVPDFTVANAEHAVRDDVTITYHNADKTVELTAGMPFQFGVTTVVARASGKAGQTDDQYWHDHTVECAFNVSVADVHNPMSHGGKYRCGKQNGVYAPFTICDGVGLQYKRANSFADTLEYDITGNFHRARGESPCCDDEHGGKYVCAKHAASDTFAYCKPEPFKKPTDAPTPPTVAPAVMPPEEAEAAPAVMPAEETEAAPEKDAAPEKEVAAEEETAPEEAEEEDEEEAAPEPKVEAKEKKPDAAEKQPIEKQPIEEKKPVEKQPVEKKPLPPKKKMLVQEDADTDEDESPTVEARRAHKKVRHHHHQ